MEYVNFNGTIIQPGEPVIKPENHSYRYGDGLFETMKVSQGNILLGDLHFDRLDRSLSILKINVPQLFSREKLEEHIFHLCEMNGCEERARIRLSVSGGNGGLYDNDNSFQYIIECWPLQHNAEGLSAEGLTVGVYPLARKSCDVFSNLKSASHLPYVMAARYAEEYDLDDALLLNAHGRICDSTVANVFWIKDKTIFTPPLSEGCIAGITRRWLMENLKYGIGEKECTIADIEEADEIFLTNAIRGISWVSQFGNRNYTRDIIQNIHSFYKLLEK